MPEPFSIATASIGTTLGILGLLAGTLSTLNNRKRRIIDFSQRLRILITSLERCQGRLADWDASWDYVSGTDSIYERIWGDRHANISTQRNEVGDQAVALEHYVREFLGIENQELNDAWRGNISRRDLFYMVKTRIRFSLFTEETLTDMVSQLDQAISNLLGLCNRCLRDITGDDLPITLSETVVRRLTRLEEFGKATWALRQGATGSFSDWTLELRTPASSTDSGDWQTLKKVRMWLTGCRYSRPHENEPEQFRMRLEYELEKGAIPTNWGQLIVEHEELQNPKVSMHNPHTQKTETLRDLFSRRHFFADVGVYKGWERDLSQLLLSLANWSILLWRTEWITNLCPSGIRYVRIGEATEPGVISPCLHTLCVRKDHDSNSGPSNPENTNEDRQVEESTPMQRDGFQMCNHGSPELKLKNLGLVLAEIICTTPFRFLATETSKYERWDGMEWKCVDEDHLLGLVEGKSHSTKVREAIGFCLQSDYHTHDQCWPSG